MWTVDYYAILEVGEGATGEEIRRAYRALAKSHHPDRNPNDPNAGARFKQLAAAYSVLSSPEARANYDASRRLWAAARPSPAVHPRTQQPATREPSARGEPSERLCSFDLGSVRVAVTREWVQVGAERMGVDAVTGIRYGVFQEHVLFIPAGRAYAAWLTDGQTILTAECSKAACGGHLGRREIEARYGQLVAALRAAVEVPLVTRMLGDLGEGHGFVVGDLFCDGYGLHRFGRPGWLRRGATAEHGPRVTHLPWDDLRSYKLVAGRLILIERSGRAWARLSMRDDWNAVLVPALLNALGQR